MMKLADLEKGFYREYRYAESGANLQIAHFPLEQIGLTPCAINPIRQDTVIRLSECWL